MCAADLAAGSLQATFEARAAARHETAEAAFPLATVIPWVSQAGQALFADGVRMREEIACIAEVQQTYAQVYARGPLVD